MMQNLLVIQKVLGKIGDSLSRIKPPNFLASLIILSSATQFGRHYWPLSSLVYGVRVDYLSPTLYFLDLLIMLFLFLHASSLREEWKTRAHWNLIPILLVNLVYSQNPLASLSWSLHLVLYLLFFATLTSQFRTLRDSSGMFGAFVTRVLTVSLLFQACLAFAQIILGHSIGGLLYYLGERNVSVGSPGIALASFRDQVVLRAYGTFSHPNILAGYAVINLLIIIWFSSAKKKFDRAGVIFPLLLTTLLVIFTQSRSASLSLFGLIIPFYLIGKAKLKTLFVYFLGLGIATLLFSSALSRQIDLSFSYRLALQNLSLSVVKVYPLFGTGAQASISTYSTTDSSARLLQPDHNSFTLFLSWFGIFGVIAILYIPRSQFENLRIWDLRFVVPLFPLLLLDHYFLTSPQGLFIFLLYGQLALNYLHVQKNRQ